MVEKFVLRTQLQIDVSPNLKRKVKELALENEKTLKELVLEALGEQHPKLQPYVNGDLHKMWDKK